MDTLCNALQQFDTRPEKKKNSNLVNSGCQMDNFFSSNNGFEKDHRPVEEDYFDGVFEYLQEVLMEEDDQVDKDCLALQAAEKSFYEALNQKPVPIPDSPNRSLNTSSNILGSQCFNSPVDDFAEICPLVITDDYHVLHNIPPCTHPDQTRPLVGFGGVDSGGKQTDTSKSASPAESSREGSSKNRNKNRARGDGEDGEDGQNSKQFASYNEGSEGTEEYDNALLCPARDPNFYGESGPKNSMKEGLEPQKPHFTPPSTGKRGRPRTGSKKNAIREVVDLRDVLGRCANLTANFDTFGANELLRKIRQHSSSYGDPTERLALVLEMP